jgi:hypothetical protein
MVRSIQPLRSIGFFKKTIPLLLSVVLIAAPLLTNAGQPLFADTATPDKSKTNGTNNAFRVFETVPPGKSLKTSPQFVVIDDFNTGSFKNKSGISWHTKAPGEGALDLAIVKKDGRNPDRGFSLKVNFNLGRHEKAMLQSFLPTLDVSQASYFVFRYRLRTTEKHNFKGHLSVKLTDWKHNQATVPVDRLDRSVNGEWQDAVFDVRNFNGVDLNQLFSIEFVFDALDEQIRGTLWLDEVAFFGFNNLAFESNRDNLAGYPKIAFDNDRRVELKAVKDDKKLLLEIAKDTWKYFVNARDTKTSLIVDHLGLGETPLAADYTSITNIAMDLLTIISALDLGFISEKDARQMTENILETLQDMRRYKNFFYNYYNTKTLAITRHYISTVDSGWLAIALVVVRQAFGGKIAEEATAFLDSFHFGEFIDPENNHMVVGLDVPERNFGGYHYGMLVSEARATSFYAIGKGDVSRDHWWYLYRTPPAVWNWQTQKPKGKFVKYDGMEVFEGYYEYQKKKFVPSWGGSLFEFLMPTLVLDEKRLAPKGLGLNNKIATEMQRDYALKEKKYPVWGISPAAMINGRTWRYVEYGIKALSVKGYPDHKVVAPHVSFLALDCLPDDAIINIRKFLDYELYGEYGFYDSLSLRNDKAVPQYLALDQGMIVIAICNYLKGDSIKRRFHKDPVAKKAEDLFSKETFF